MQPAESRGDESAYARSVGARTTRFIAGASAEDALVRAGLLGGGDALVAFDPDGPSHAGPSLCGYARFAVDGFEPAVFEAASNSAGERGRLFWLVPATGGYGIRVCDVRALSVAAAECSAVLAVDATPVSSFGSRPLAAGASLMFERITGEGEDGCKTLFALSVGRTPRRQRATDNCIAWVASVLTGLPECAAECSTKVSITLQDASHIQKRMDSARAVAEYLAANDMVLEVFYPGLVTHADHAVATSNLMHGFGYRIDMRLPDGLSAERFIKTLPASMQPPFSGTDSTRAVAVKGLNEPYLRLIAGIDDPLCIVDSLDQALRLYCNPPEPL